MNATDLNPSESRKRAGNYRKKKIRWNGLRISIENPVGSIRSGTDATGKKWQTLMRYDYGYIRGTKGKDGDHVDVFIGPHDKSELVTVINQVDPKTRKFDEHKVMIGFFTKKEAIDAYLSNYEPGWKGMGDAVTMSLDQFKRWVRSGRKMGPANFSISTDAARVVDLGFRIDKQHSEIGWKSQAAAVKPEEFLEKAEPIANPSQKAIDKYRHQIRSKSKIPAPQLWIRRKGKGIGHHPGNFNVIGHEGRHRMIAAKLEGVKRVPVEVIATGEERVPKRSKILKRAIKMVRHFKPEGRGFATRLKPTELSEKPFHGYNKNRHARTGGLSDSYRKAYNAKTGSKLRRPVTKSPSKLQPGSKAAKRRASFCKRMSGVKGPTSKGGKLTPKGAALKRWNCNARIDICSLTMKERKIQFASTAVPLKPEEERKWRGAQTAINTAGVLGTLGVGLYSVRAARQAGKTANKASTIADSVSQNIDPIIDDVRETSRNAKSITRQVDRSMRGAKASKYLAKKRLSHSASPKNWTTGKLANRLLKYATKGRRKFFVSRTGRLVELQSRHRAYIDRTHPVGPTYRKRIEDDVRTRERAVKKGRITGAFSGGMAGMAVAGPGGAVLGGKVGSLAGAGKGTLDARKMERRQAGNFGNRRIRDEVGNGMTGVGSNLAIAGGALALLANRRKIGKRISKLARSISKKRRGVSRVSPSNRAQYRKDSLTLMRAGPSGRVVEFRRLPEPREWDGRTGINPETGEYEDNRHPVRKAMPSAIAGAAAAGAGLGLMYLNRSKVPYQEGLHPLAGTAFEPSAKREARAAAVAAAAEARRIAKAEAKKQGKKRPRAYGGTRGSTHMRAIMPGVRNFNQNVRNPQHDNQWTATLSPPGAYRKAQSTRRWARRAGEVGKDLDDIVSRRPRDPKRKRFYEKSWFKNAVTAGAIAAPVIASRQLARARKGIPALDRLGKIGRGINQSHREGFPIFSANLKDRLVELREKIPDERDVQRKYAPLLGHSKKAVIQSNQRPKDSIKTADDSVPRASSYREVVKSAKDQGIGPVTRNAAALKTRLHVWSGQNAAFLPKGKKGVIITPKKVNPDVLKHEVGHAIDYRKLGGEKGWKKAYGRKIDNALSGVSKKRYIRTKMLPEERAWAYAGKIDDKRIKEGALRTYANAGPHQLLFNSRWRRLVELSTYRDSDETRMVGWDVRDARGNSARVFTPDARARSRRKKKPHERVSNIRAQRNAAIAAAALGAGLGIYGMTGRNRAIRAVMRKANRKPGNPPIPFPKQA